MTPSPARILHMVPDAVWDEVVSSSAETYVPERYALDGFTHLSGVWQVTTPANALFSGREDLVVLVVDAALLGDALVWEAGDGTDELFPHLYAPMPVSAVVVAHPFPCDEDGAFSVTPELEALCATSQDETR